MQLAMKPLAWSQEHSPGQVVTSRCILYFFLSGYGLCLPSSVFSFADVHIPLNCDVPGEVKVTTVLSILSTLKVYIFLAPH